MSSHVNILLSLRKVVWRVCIHKIEYARNKVTCVVLFHRLDLASTLLSWRGSMLHPIPWSLAYTGKLSLHQCSRDLLMRRDAFAFPVLLLCALIAERQLRIPKLKELPVSQVGVTTICKSMLIVQLVRELSSFHSLLIININVCCVCDCTCVSIKHVSAHSSSLENSPRFRALSSALNGVSKFCTFHMNVH